MSDLIDMLSVCIATNNSERQGDSTVLSDTR